MCLGYSTTQFLIQIFIDPLSPEYTDNLEKLLEKHKEAHANYERLARVREEQEKEEMKKKMEENKGKEENNHQQKINTGTFKKRMWRKHMADRSWFKGYDNKKGAFYKKPLLYSLNPLGIPVKYLKPPMKTAKPKVVVINDD